MVKRFYLDTSIWRDYFEDRVDKFRPLGLFAFQFLNECRNKGHKVLYSDLILFELRKEYSEERIKSILSEFHNILERVESTDKQK